MTRTTSTRLPLLALAVATTLLGLLLSPAYAAPRPLVWAAVGDSITYGWGASDCVGFGQPCTHAYPHVAGVPSAGFPGQCLVATGCWFDPLVDMFPDELAGLQAQGVNAVVVEIGINDIGQTTYRQYRDGYRRLRAIGAARGVWVVFSTITPFGPGRNASAADQAQRERVNRWIRSHGPYVDYAAALSAPDGTLAPTYDSGDGTHPSDAGHAAMAAALDLWMDVMSAVGRPGPAPCVRSPCGPS